MTYLQAVNNVLRRMRESEVTAIANSEYSKMIGDLVNDALRIVQDSWNWSALRQTLTITTEVDVKNYALTGFGTDGVIFDAVNVTQKIPMRQASKLAMDRMYKFGPVSSSVPTTFAMSTVSTDASVDLYPMPDGVYDIDFNVCIKQEDLTLDADVILVPNKPVIYYALAMAVRERGETGGTSVAEYFEIASKALSDAISLDSQNYQEELVWTV